MSTETHHAPRRRPSRRASRTLVAAGLSAAWIAGVATLYLVASSAQAATL